MVRRHGLRLVLGTLASLLIVLAGASPAFAAAPRIILVTGGGLTRPVVLDDWQENLAIMLASSDAADAHEEGLADRLSYRIAMFWGPEWDQYMQAGKDPGALRPEQANQLARYYPPTAAHVAVLAFDSIPGSGAIVRRLDAKGVSILLQHGVSTNPTTSSHPAATPAQPLAVLIVLGGSVGVVGLWLSLRTLRRRRSE